MGDESCDPDTSGTDTSGAARTRTSCRVVLLDQRDRVLLIRVVDDGELVIPGEPPPPPTYWVTPGGGVEDGEGFEATARRELFEETGIGDAELGTFLWERRKELVWHDEPMTGVERYYAAYVERAEANLDHLVTAEVGVIVDHRWWTLDEITDERRRETIFPPEIGRLVAEAAAGRP